MRGETVGEPYFGTNEPAQPSTGALPRSHRKPVLNKAYAAFH